MSDDMTHKNVALTQTDIENQHRQFSLGDRIPRGESIMRAKDIDPTNVRRLATTGQSIRAIAIEIGCSHDTIERHFRKELDEGYAEWKSSCRVVVLHLSGAGCSHKEIAGVLNVSPDTVERHFADMLATGQLRLRASIREQQIKIMMSGGPGAAQMAIWLGKIYLGQRDPDKVSSTVIKKVEVSAHVPLDTSQEKAAFDHDCYAELFAQSVNSVTTAH